MAQPQLTKNQRAVLDALNAVSTPLSAYEILDQDDVRAKGLRTAVTIYRALDRLTELGLVHRLETLNAYLPCCEHGTHDEPASFLICEKCKRAVEVPLGHCVSHLMMAGEAEGYEIDKVRVEMTGVCPDCR